MRITFGKITAVALCAFVLAAMPAHRAPAQWNAALQVMSTYDNNSFAFYDRRADVYHQVFLAVSRDFETDYSFVQPYYYGAAVLFRTYDKRSYHQHTLGMLWTIQLDHRDDDGDDDSIDTTADEGADSLASNDDGDADSSDAELDTLDTASTGRDANREEGIAPAVPKRETLTVTPTKAPTPSAAPPAPSPVTNDSTVTYLHIKPSIAGRFDRDAYDIYDFKTALIDATLRYNLVGQLIGRLQYGIAYKAYPTMPQFTNLENVAGMVLSLRLHPRTEVFASADFGYKIYTETVSDTTYTSGNSGKGKGGVKQRIKSIASFSTPSTDQVVMALGIVETVAQGHVVTLSYLRRINPRNVARFLDKRDSTNIQAYEADVFDDRYGYQADELCAHYESKLFGTAPLSVNAEYQRKTYPRMATSIFGIANTPAKNRADTRFEITVQCMVPLLHKADGSTSLSLGGAYSFTRNQSNDAYHDYHIHQAAAILEVTF